MAKHKVRAHASEIKLVERAEGDAPGDLGKLTGYIAVFNSDSEDLGGFVEQIKPGAYADSLKSRDVVCLKNHNHDDVLGRLSAGTLKLEEDDHGLHFELSIPDTSAGRDLVVLARRGDLKGCSFGFDIENPEDMEWTARGDEQLCTLLRIVLFEVSVGVTFPAYEATEMQLNALRERARSTAGREAPAARIARERDRQRLALALTRSRALGATAGPGQKKERPRLPESRVSA